MQIKNDREMTDLIEACFGSVEKPEHFTDYLCCEECLEHDQLLREKDKATLSIEDVGNICWQPLSSCSGEGIAYYMPALARLALSPPTHAYGWYGETLGIHLSFSQGRNRLHDYCNAGQRKAVSTLLKYLSKTRPELMGPEARDEFMALADQWETPPAARRRKGEM